MTKPPQSVLELPLPDRGLLALRAAVKKVIEEHAREGSPLYTLRNGKVVAVPARELLEENGNKARRRRRLSRHKSR